MWYDVFHFILDVNYLIFFWKEHLYGWRAIAFGRHLLLQTKHRWRGYLAPISMMLNIYTRGSFLFCCELRCAHFDGDSMTKNSDRRITFSVINNQANTWSARFMLSTEQRSSTDLDWLLLSYCFFWPRPCYVPSFLAFQLERGSVQTNRPVNKGRSRRGSWLILTRP